MRNIIFALFFWACGPQAWAQEAASAPSGSASRPGVMSPFPPCWPKQWGSTGSDYKMGEDVTTDGQLGLWLGWTCQVKGKPKVFGFVWRRNFTPTPPVFTGPTTISESRALWAHYVRDGDATLDPLRLALHRAFE